MFWQEVYELPPKQADGLEVTSVTPQRRSVQQERLQFHLRELRRLALQLMANCTLPPCSVAVDQIGPHHQNVSRHETVITGDSTSYSRYCIFRKSG